MFNNLQASMMFLVTFKSSGLKAKFWLGWLWKMIELAALVFSINCKTVLGSMMVFSWLPTLSLATPNTFKFLFNNMIHASSWWCKQSSKKGRINLYASIAIVTLGLSFGCTFSLYLISTSDNLVKSSKSRFGSIPVLISGDKYSSSVINLIDKTLI